jgi:hypothetical protein
MADSATPIRDLPERRPVLTCRNLILCLTVAVTVAGWYAGPGLSFLAIAALVLGVPIPLALSRLLAARRGRLELGLLRQPLGAKLLPIHCSSGMCCRFAYCWRPHYLRVRTTLPPSISPRAPTWPSRSNSFWTADRDLTADSVVPLTTDTESASVGALAEGGEGAGGAPGVGVDQPAPPGRTVGRGDPGEPVIGGLGREVLPTLLGEDREGVVVCHVSSLGLSPPRHMGQIADL